MKNGNGSMKVYKKKNDNEGKWNNEDKNYSRSKLERVKENKNGRKQKMRE